MKVEATGGNLTVIRGWECGVACCCSSLTAICAYVCDAGDRDLREASGGAPTYASVRLAGQRRHENTVHMHSILDRTVFFSHNNKLE